jgi:stage III sporulation protein AF
LDTLRLLVQNLIIIVVLAVLLEMLLPNGEMRRYTKMVLGLMIIVAVIQAVSGISRGTLFGEINEFTWRSPGQSGTVNILEQGQKIDEDNRKLALEQYRRGIERQVAALAGLDGKVGPVSADVKLKDDPAKQDFGKIQEISLIIGRRDNATDSSVKAVESISVRVAGEGNDDEQKAEPAAGYDDAAANAARVVAGFYNLSPDQVRVIIEK